MVGYDVVTRILLYSEDRKQNELVREAVMMSGYEGKLLYADNREAALEQLRAVPVDLLIASIRIRRGEADDYSEYRFLEEVRSLQKKAKLIISADEEGDLEYVVNQIKCNLYLTRPRLREAMKDEIAEFIRMNFGVSQLRSSDRRYFFRYGRKVYILQEHEILLYESTDKEGFVFTREKKINVNVQDLRTDGGIRGSARFVRCNPCDHVNIDYIREYDRHRLFLMGVKNPVHVTKSGWENLERMRNLFI
jgi:hypothetical protein